MYFHLFKCSKKNYVLGEHAHHLLTMEFLPKNDEGITRLASDGFDHFGWELAHALDGMSTPKNIRWF